MADEFILEKTFLDITDTSGLSANQTREYNPDGSSGTANYMTPNTVSSSSTNGAVAREIVSVEIIPPQDQYGNYQDLREVWLILDNKSIQHYINLPGIGWILMTPLRTQIVGGKTFRINFGEPLWRAVQNPNNMPIRAICPKFRRTLAIAVRSEFGVQNGYRIIVKGYEYTPAHLAALAPQWRNDVYVQTLRRQVVGAPPLQFTFQPAGPLSLDTWTSYPGGIDQRGYKINPLWQFAINASATQPSRAYAFTNLNALAGGTGHVEDTYQDLGLEFNLNNNAAIIRGFGVRGVPLMPGQPGSTNSTGQYTGGTPGLNLTRAGFIVNGDVVPSEEGGNNGFYVTEGVNPLAFGAVQPYRSNPNEFFPVPRLPGELLIYKDNYVPFVADNGSPIPAFQVAVCHNGVVIENV